MSKLVLGVVSGLGLGLIDGASAVFNPEAQSMLAVIIVSATIKGGISGALIGYLSPRFDGLTANIAIGAVIGLVLSVLAAIPSGSYVEIILPGTVLGVLVGLIVAKFGREANLKDI